VLKKIKMYSIGSFIKGSRDKDLTESKKINDSNKSKISGRFEHIFVFTSNSINDPIHLRHSGQHRIASTIGL
jgi:hypothetical protein